MDQSPPRNVQTCFDELSQLVRALFSDQEPNLFFELELELRGNVWLVKVRTNELPTSKVFGLLKDDIDKINKEEDFTFLLTLENPR